MNVSKTITENLNFMKQALSYPLSEDVILREFTINAGLKRVRAFLMYFEGTTKGSQIDEFILQSLHLIPRRFPTQDLADLIENQLISRNQLAKVTTMDEVLQMVNYGGCALFVDTVDVAFVADVKGWDVRGIDAPSAEAVVRGPHQAFNETLRTNTGLMRKIVRDEKMVCEGFSLGKRSHTSCNMLYIRDIANDSLVAEARRRLKQIDVDFIFDSGELEQLLEGFTFAPTPQMLSTERPDRVAAALSDGKVALLLDGSPFALILPINLFELAHTVEDNYLRYPFANLLRLMRIFAMLTSVLLPGLFIAVATYHHEAIPTHLLFAIEASREQVPFPLIVELIMMEIAFEFIREASVRAPAAIGQTIGIIGGLIIGQAAVEANLVSPIVIIIVALTGIGSLATPNYALSFSFRVMKYWYILCGAVAGFLGFAFGLFLHLLILCNSQSFGVPFLAPCAPKYDGDAVGTLFVKPIWKRERRQQMLYAKQPTKQAHISRKWAKGDGSTLSGPKDDTEVE